MQVCADEAELVEAYASVERLSRSHFGQGGVFLEKFIVQARHLEVQIFGDGQGTVVSLGVRDCSAQRRNQKVIEETPPVNVADSVVAGLQDAALNLARAVSYRSAGTVEFVYDESSGDYYFLEVNTRLQVEHGVTELVTGVDLVRWMVEMAAGDMQLAAEPSVLPQHGHAIQTRLYAEDPNKNFQPSSGLLTHVAAPDVHATIGWPPGWTSVHTTIRSWPSCKFMLPTGRPWPLFRARCCDTPRRDRDQPSLASIVDAPVYRAGVLTKSLAEHAFRPRSRDPARRDDDHRAGFSRTCRLLGGRGATFRTDGS